MSGGGSDLVVGFKYLFGIHMGLGRGPVDEIVEIKVGDKTAWRGSIVDNGATLIDVPNLFGGEKGEGGIQGTLTTMMGGPTQTADPALATVLQAPMPGFRRMATVFFDGIISMMNPYPKAWKFRVRRALLGWDGGAAWYPEKAIISLVRPVSEGEVSGNDGSTSETKVITTVFSGIPTTDFPNVGPWLLTIVPEGEPITITSVYFDRLSQITEAGELYQAEHLVEGTHYTVSGLDITLVLTADPWFYDGVTVHVVYDYTLTTVTPGSGPGGLGDALIQAMNPIHILYECLTNREWGRGLNAALLDDTNWRYAADQAHTERLGLCLRWNRRDEIQSFIQSVLDHIGGVTYDDRRTGKIKVKLIRDDYDKADLPLFDKDSGLLEITEAEVPSLAGMINEMKVSYTDPVTDETRTVRHSNLAAVRASGGAINGMTKNYPGIPTPDLASRIAKRDLRALSPAVRRFKVSLDRRGYSVTPGSVLRIQDLVRNIPDMVLRVGPVDYGHLGEGKITFSAMQDVFGMPQRGFTTIGPPQWTPPTAKPCVGISEVFEMPYRSVYRSMTTADFSFVDPGSAYLGVVSQEGQPLNATFNTAVRPGAVEVEDEPPDTSYFCET